MRKEIHLDLELTGVSFDLSNTRTVIETIGHTSRYVSLSLSQHSENNNIAERKTVLSQQQKLCSICGSFRSLRD